MLAMDLLSIFSKVPSGARDRYRYNYPFSAIPSAAREPYRYDYIENQLETKLFWNGKILKRIGIPHPLPPPHRAKTGRVGLASRDSGFGKNANHPGQSRQPVLQRIRQRP